MNTALVCSREHFSCLSPALVILHIGETALSQHAPPFFCRKIIIGKSQFIVG